ncbi:hypothetical protein Cgig2_034176 [Carnegiea gigantea]|uniref:Uncharacterized protein n=1 Tax=Carnegiea gigantea TaxID=171969 RepID=A0A9Q1JIA9_9CARY|nr:hypothetical protein Cgig2_034176 [Carnegiea gigantea]
MARGHRGRRRHSQNTRLYLNSNSSAEVLPEASVAPPSMPDQIAETETAEPLLEATSKVTLPSTCASLVDPEEGTDLRTDQTRDQVDVNIFLHLNKVGLIGMFETKVKKKNVEKVAAKVFPGWRWIYNFHLDPRGRIWVAWNPKSYQIKPMHELRSIGAYYSVWSRIDRALTNVYWSDVFNFTQVRYDTNSLSNHTPLLIQFPQSPKAKTKFQYCDIWAKYENFHTIITAALPNPSSTLNLL